MKIQFVYPNVVKHPKDINIGLAILSAILKRAGHEVQLIDTTFGMSDTEIVSRLRKFSPDLIAMTSLSNNFTYATYVAELIKSACKTPIIIGGVHTSVAPEEVISRDCFDAICIGEGEEALPAYIDSMERGGRSTDIPGFWLKAGGKIIRNRVQHLKTDIDSLPDADYDLYDYSRYLKSHNMVVSILGSRGCPYLCTYCVNHAYKQLYKGKGPFVRYRSVDRVVAEAKRLVEKHGGKEVCLMDDTFTLKKNRVREFSEKFKKDVNLPFHINARVDNVDEEICRSLAEGGCRRVSIGLESGDPFIRKEILKRNISDETILEGCRLIKKYGMELFTYNMIGIPGEKLCNIKKTIGLNRKIQPDYVSAHIFTAYKGTDLYRVCKENGWLDEDRPIDSYFFDSNVKHPHLPLKKLKHIRSWFGFWVFIRHSPKRAIVELIDRNLLRVNQYLKLRSYLIAMLRNNKRHA